MRANAARVSAVLSLLGFLASPALAQMIGNPVYFSPKQGVGLTLGADYGRGVNNASLKTNYFGGRATLGLPMVSIQVGGGTAKPSGGTSAASFGGDVAVTVLKGPMVPVSISLQGGAAYSSVSGFKTLHAPIGAALAVNVKSPGASVEPWVAPRLDYQKYSGTGTGSQTKFGASAGLNVGLPTGLGFHVALDYLNVSSGASPFYAGAGVHYHFTIPGIGAVVK